MQGAMWITVGFSFMGAFQSLTCMSLVDDGRCRTAAAANHADDLGVGVLVDFKDTPVFC